MCRSKNFWIKILQQKILPGGEWHGLMVSVEGLKVRIPAIPFFQSGDGHDASLAGDQVRFGGQLG